ncbi:hypothetical protein RhiJN_22972 [Ceratobasidium sp. AG-Ba]|nr:hypothetical protein RhiJN_22972 [Ceratobasidium sp. AG-Ba]
MATYRNPRSLTTARRPTHGTSSPIRCCYPYTPASPQPSRLQPPANLGQELAIMHPHSNPLFPNSTRVTRSLPENPTSDLALPSLEHLANALHALSTTPEGSSRSRSKHSASDRVGRVPSCERRSSHRRRSRVSSRSRDRRSTRDHSGIEPEHVPAPTWSYEAVSPKTPVRKMHYVPATPSSSMCSPPPVAPKLFSPAAIKEVMRLPTPPSSHSSSPRQAPSSPPKRHYTPAPSEAPIPPSEVKLLPPVIQVSVPTPPSQTSPLPSVEKPKAVMSKLTRFALAGREFDGDDAAINALMTSFDYIVDSLVRLDDDEDEDHASELSID